MLMCMQVLKDTTLTAPEQQKVIKQAAAQAIVEEHRQPAAAAGAPGPTHGQVSIAASCGGGMAVIDPQAH
jgi:hypothetical protein